MSTFFTIDELKARLPYTANKIDATSQPTETQAQAWIDEAENEVTVTIQAIGGVIPTDAPRMDLIGIHVGDYSEARVRLAWAAAGGDDDNEDGQEVMGRYLDWLKDLQERREYWSGVFITPGDPIVATTALRGVGAADAYLPEFTRNERY